MNLSLYCSAFNLESGLFDWEESLDKFSRFGDELVIGTTALSNDNTVKLLERYASRKSNVKLTVTDFSLDDPLFDGKIKNAALDATTLPAKILLDLDEEIPYSQKDMWIYTFEEMLRFNYDCMMIASINLCKDKYHYKDIGFKFYLHRSGLKRGVWNQAKNTDGSIDIKKSDSTEILLESGELPKIYPLSNDIRMLREYKIPYVFHHWGDNLEKRIERNKFWKPVWESRAKRKVNDIILDKLEIEKIPVFEHNLPLE